MPSQSVKDFPWDWQHVVSTILVRPSQGVLHSVVLNQNDTKGMISIYDGLDGTGALIAVIVVGFNQPRYLLFDLEFKTGLYLLVVGEWDLTVNYK